MRKILIIASREYWAMVATKAFLLTLVLMPVMMGGGIVVQESLPAAGQSRRQADGRPGRDGRAT